MVPHLHGVVVLALGTSLAAASNLNVPELFSGPDAPQHHPVLVAPRVSPTSTDHRATTQRTTTGIRPEKYGAVPNDGHSDYRALQRAIDTAARRGVPVRLSANARYDSNHWLRLRNNSTLVGAGPSSELKFHWRKNNNSNDGCYICNWDQTTGNRHITVARLHIVGAASGKPAGLSAMNPVPNTPAIRFRLVHGLRVRHVEISRAPGISMLVQGSRGVRIVGNHVHNSGRDGINIGWYKVDSRRVLVKGNLIQRVGDDGVAIIGAPPTRHEPKGVQFRVVHNRILGWKVDPNGLQLGRGISVLGARRVLIKHDRIRDPDSAGILISPSSRPDRFNHHAPWKSKRVRVVRNDVGSIDSTGLLIKNSVRIHWGLNVFSNVRPTVKVFTCRLCSRL
jgi:hypothetical protein